jgi:hypothetical protein
VIVALCWAVMMAATWVLCSHLGHHGRPAAGSDVEVPAIPV